MTHRIRPRALDISSFFRHIQNVIRDVDRQLLQRDDGTLDNCLFRVESALINLQRIEDHVEDGETFRRLFTQLQEFFTLIQSLERQRTPNQGYQAPVHAERRLGRPSFDIPQQQLIYLLGMSFQAPEIAKMLGVSVRTIRNRMSKYGLSCTAFYAELGDEELDEKVNMIVELNSNIGYRFVRATLESQGCKVPYHRVRNSLLRVNGAAVALRYGNTVQRRVYNVTIPNQLWHFDGNHKLIEWKFVVHGCIDGASRFVTFLKVATDNKAATVLAAFEEAVVNHGLPSRVRCDRGVENGKVIEYMVRKRGPDHRAAIVGPSVHNQRIERLWVDVFQGALCVFHDIFTTLTREAALDRTNELQMYAFHYSFLPIIQRALDRWRMQHNFHPITTLRCKSPNKVFTEGIYANAGNPSTGVADFLSRGDDMADFGIDPQGPIPEVERLTSEVHVPAVRANIPANVIRELEATIKPCEEVTGDNGTQVYRAALQFLLDRGC